MQNIRNPIELEIDKPTVLFHLIALSKEPGFMDQEYFNTNYFGILKSEIHHRRIQKLFFSTNIFPKAVMDNGYKFNYDFKSSIIDWMNSCEGQDLN